MERVTSPLTTWEPFPDRTYSAALADVNHDGYLDVVISNDQPDRKLIYLNDGKGNFHVSGTFGDPQLADPLRDSRRS